MRQHDDSNGYNGIDHKTAIMQVALETQPESSKNGSWTWTVPEFSLTVVLQLES